MLKRFRRDEKGAVYIYFAVLIPVLLGIIGLTLEGGSLLHLNSELQELADASALAGAKEMDGAQDALTRATAAATSLLNNDPTWSNIAAAGVQITTPVYYSSIAGAGTVTTDPKQAQFIRVTTINRGVSAGFVRAVSSTTTSNTSATATASVTYTSCAAIQSFMCNPWEFASGYQRGNSSNFAGNVTVGSQFHLLADGTGAPGNWGLLESSFGNGANAQEPFWAMVSAGACEQGAGKEVRTGNIPKKAQDGMNVRFNSPISSGDGQISAPIVINGHTVAGSNYNCKQFVAPDNTWTAALAGTGSQAGLTFKQTDAGSGANSHVSYGSYCNASPVIGSCPLPRDRTLSTTVNRGSGATLADLQAYWTNHHPGPLPAGVTTRYQIYQLEVAGTGDAGTWRTDAKEPHAPSCSNATTGGADRRLINVGIVDCDYWSINGQSDPLPASLLVARFFMTESALEDGSIYAELIDMSVANTGPGSVYQTIQLVR